MIGTTSYYDEANMIINRLVEAIPILIGTNSYYDETNMIINRLVGAIPILIGTTSYYDEANMIINRLVGARGFEPPTSYSRSRRADRTALRPDLDKWLVVSGKLH